MSLDEKGQCAVLKQVISEMGQDKSIVDNFSKANSKKELDSTYRAAIHECEERIWKGAFTAEKLAIFQKLNREYQTISSSPRKKFIIVIPVADRPQHLNSCLNSLLKLCHYYGYGDHVDNKYTHVSVVVADDSKDITNISENEKISNVYRKQGLNIDYFGQKQQIDLLTRLPESKRNELNNIIGSYEFDDFAHKGASVMRNIVYLKLRSMKLADDEYLIHFIDSDQEFNVCIPASDSGVYAINYLYDLNHLFTTHDIEVLTGKVVGDPPVSPAVMTNRLLDDVSSFLHEYNSINITSKCSFHKDSASADDASYHDMAEMFGFENDNSKFRYTCHIEGEHNHADCFSGFASRLKGFFYGAHPTRRTWYQYSSAEESLIDARTVYTGNYIIKPSALRYFIPFASLKLRMAGPVLGRIIKSQVASRFASSNLPMLHSRTIQEQNASEFRSGVDSVEDYIDLSGEFENQYFGDVMLFSLEKLVSTGYPFIQLDQNMIMDVLTGVDEQVHRNYMDKQSSIISKVDEITSILGDLTQNWGIDADSEFLDNIYWFINNIKYNYSRDAKIYAVIDSHEYRVKKLGVMCDKLMQYVSDIELWNNISTELVTS